MKHTGHCIRLRPIDTSDAAFVIRLRTDPNLARHLSPTRADVDEQVAYIRRTAAQPDAHYFIIEDRASVAVGTVRLYDFRGESFCWGSWILSPEAPRKAAIESAVLVYLFGFDELGFTRSHFDVRRQNEKALAFHRRFGARFVSEDARNLYFEYEKLDFEQNRSFFMSFISGDR